jgi:hypothetical protein
MDAFVPPKVADAELTVSTTAKGNTPTATRAKKNALMEKAVADLQAKGAAQAAAPKEPDAPPPKPREPVETIEVKLLDGRLIVFGPPSGVSLTMRIATTIPEATNNMIVQSLARVCMSVRSIDGQVPRPIGNMVDLTLMANNLGDQGLDILNYWFNEHWGDIKISELGLVKKNLR